MISPANVKRDTYSSEKTNSSISNMGSSEKGMEIYKIIGKEINKQMIVIIMLNDSIFEAIYAYKLVDSILYRCKLNDLKSSYIANTTPVDKKHIAKHKIADIKYKNSRQRTRILELLRSTGKHPTAAWLYENLKSEFKNLSMGTVYRNLNILVEQGLAKKIGFGSTFDRYEANTDRHYHLICRNCGRIIDLEYPFDLDLDKKVETKTKFKIEDHQIQFYGLCNECR